METKVYLVCIAVAILVGQQSSAMPSVGKVVEVGQEPLDDDRRATWLDTRNREANFKELVYLSVQELVHEGRLSPQILVAGRDKRGRHQGFCFKKTKSGRFLPYICWKGESEQEEK